MSQCASSSSSSPRYRLESSYSSMAASQSRVCDWTKETSFFAGGAAAKRATGASEKGLGTERRGSASVSEKASNVGARGGCDESRYRCSAAEARPVVGGVPEGIRTTRRCMPTARASAARVGIRTRRGDSLCHAVLVAGVAGSASCGRCGVHACGDAKTRRFAMEPAGSRRCASFVDEVDLCIARHAVPSPRHTPCRRR